MRLIASGKFSSERKVTVGEIMNTNPTTVEPETATVVAIRLMREKQLSCLPVVREGKLVGLVTEHDLIVVASVLLEDSLSEKS